MSTPGVDSLWRLFTAAMMFSGWMMASISSPRATLRGSLPIIAARTPASTRSRSRRAAGVGVKGALSCCL